MKNSSYTATIEVGQSPEAAFHAVCTVTEWWSKDFSGKSTDLHDEFVIHHPGQHYSRQKLVECIPGKKITWLVTESRLHWLKNDPEEWTNTRMIFELSSDNGKTRLHFTHEGLIPGKECYAMCGQGWNIVVKNWLRHYITNGNPSPEMERAAEIRNRHFKSGQQT